LNLERVKGIEPSAEHSQTPQPQAVPQAQDSDYTQIRAQISKPADLDLAQVVEAWPALSQPLKAAVLAVVAAAKSLKGSQP
jgi:hypothetical protein